MGVRCCFVIIFGWVFRSLFTVVVLASRRRDRVITGRQRGPLLWAGRTRVKDQRHCESITSLLALVRAK